MTLQYDFFAQTDPGRIRENNEDAVVFDGQYGIAVLADGMGGYNAGEIASGMATTFIKSELGRWLQQAGAGVGPKDVRRAIELCVNQANQSIFHAAHTNAQYAGMGTTLVLSVFFGARMVLGHIGDSRCYRLRQGVFEQITRDHSLLQEQIDAGLVTPEQAAGSNIKNLVTRALGVEPQVDMELNDFAVEPGDIYLLCSDGLSDMVDNPSIGRMISTSTDLEQIGQLLVNAANANGGRDNISVLLVQASALENKRGLIARLFNL
jgi:PPM family protein phosphatase